MASPSRSDGSVVVEPRPIVKHLDSFTLQNLNQKSVLDDIHEGSPLTTNVSLELDNKYIEIVTTRYDDLTKNTIDTTKSKSPMFSSRQSSRTFSCASEALPYFCRHCSIYFNSKTEISEHVNYSKIHQLSVIENPNAIGNEESFKVRIKTDRSLRLELVRRLSRELKSPDPSWLISSENSLGNESMTNLLSTAHMHSRRRLQM